MNERRSATITQYNEYIYIYIYLYILIFTDSYGNSKTLLTVDSTALSLPPFASLEKGIQSVEVLSSLSSTIDDSESYLPLAGGGKAGCLAVSRTDLIWILSAERIPFYILYT
jgi:hypothetical protein